MKYFKIVIMLAVLIPNFVFAQDQGSLPISTGTPISTVIATVEIYNATSTHKGNKATISFDITNRTGIQPGVKYAAVLLLEKNKQQTIVDEYVYDEVLSLDEHSSVHKTIEYQAPSTLDGVYKLFVSSKNVSGFPFAFAFAGNITLTKDIEVSGIHVNTDSCFLTVKGEIPNKKYTALQGVDISLDEDLQSNCLVENSSNSQVIVSPSFVTRLRSSFGDVITTTGGDVSPITFLPHEKKMVVTTLPKGEKSQMYNLTIKYGEKSNKMEYRYALWGNSGTIQNIVLDKDYYKKGDIADMSFTWLPALDSFYTSRKGNNSTSSQVVSILLLDKNNKPCNDIFTQNLTNKDSYLHFKINVTSECYYSKVNVKLSDKNLNTFDELTFENATKQEIKNNYMIESVLSFVVLVLSLFALFILKKRRGAAISLAVIFLFSFVHVDAATLQVTDINGMVPGIFYYTIGVDKPSYSAGESVTASCNYSSASHSSVTSSITVNATINGVTKDAITSNTFTAPSSGGSYSASFNAGGSITTRVGQCGGCDDITVIMSGNGSIPYSVAVPAPTVEIRFSFLDIYKRMLEFLVEPAFASVVAR